ncbi:hypothetical protein [Bradyrhizobium sp. LA2.1]|uniref:hypothetical protein n=1 Tax=Bradyrhizobium sp. LA2.1 TaxID=3156376 RepID=UPI00339B1EFA
MTMNQSIPDALDVAVAHHTRLGGRRADDMLGIQQMPFGYALLIDADETYFNWLRYDGQEGAQTWNKWAAYRGAKWNFDNSTAPIHKPLVVMTGNS